MFVVMSRFTVANGMTRQVKDGFVNRPHYVDGASGFVRMDVISPLEKPDEIWLLTYWTDRDSYQTWHNGPEHHASHKFIPKGLKLVPGSVKIECFEYVAS